MHCWWRPEGFQLSDFPGDTAIPWLPLRTRWHARCRRWNRCRPHVRCTVPSSKQLAAAQTDALKVVVLGLVLGQASQKVKIEAAYCEGHKAILHTACSVRSYSCLLSGRFPSVPAEMADWARPGQLEQASVVRILSGMALVCRFNLAISQRIEADSISLKLVPILTVPYVEFRIPNGESKPSLYS